MSYSSSSSSPSSSSSDLEAGFFGCAPPRIVYSPPPPAGKRMGGRTYRPRLFFCDDLDDDGPRHFLDSCFLCKKHLGGNRDIFMYRGDTPFCSEECRQEQIEIDEEREMNWKLSLKTSSRKERQSSKQQQKTKADTTAAGGSPPKSDKIHVRATGTVVAG